MIWHSQRQTLDKPLAIRTKYRFLFVSAPFGGIEVFFRNLERTVGKHGDIEATWVWLDFNPREWFTRVPLLSSNWTLKGGLVTRARIRGLEDANGHFDAAMFNHAICAMFAGNFSRRVPLVLSLDVTPRVMRQYRAWYQNGPGNEFGIVARMKESMARRVYARARFILPWSGLVRDSLACDYGVDARKMNIVPPGIDIEQMRPASTGLKALSTNGKTNILFVGADFLRKGGDLLMDVARRDEFKNCCFHIVTHDEAVSGTPNVTVHTGMAANSEGLLRLYETADIFVLPTRADLSPNAIAEAMAFGLPVVATDVGAIREMVEHGRNGILVPMNEPNALAQSLGELISDVDKRRRMGIHGRKLAEDKLNMTSNAEKILDRLRFVADHPDDALAAPPSARKQENGAPV